MKNLFTILMIMLFGISASGATIKLHYCCGKLKSISWGHVQEKDCGMQGKMDGKPCCETKSVSAKDQQDHEVYTVAFGVKAPVEPAIIHHQLPAPIVNHPAEVTPHLQTTPPLAEDILTLHCVFRI